MMRVTIAGGAFAAVLVLFALAADHRAGEQDVDHRAGEQNVDLAAVVPPAPTPSPGDAGAGLLYGRVITDDGAVYEGRLRFGGDEEALWGNTFNAAKSGNSWADHVPDEQLPKERFSIGAFGFEITGWDFDRDLGRPFMARLGDIARIDAPGRDLRVTLRSGTVVDLARFGADDFADGVRIWDDTRGVVDLDEWRIDSIEFLPGAPQGAAPHPLHGTVRTRQGDFTGFVQWDRKACLGSDELNGHAADGEVGLRFDAIRSIARRSGEGALVTLLDGREIVLSDTRKDGRGNSGMYVDDPRYGRVLVSWEAFEGMDFTPGGAGPAYGDFQPGRPLRGAVTTRFGHRLAGRLVYDLDEGETTETLDAPSQGVDYMIPFSLIASIVLPRLEGGGAQLASVTLHDGEELQLERTGDLSEWNAGMLVFVDGRQRPEYVPWTDLARVDFERPQGM